MRSETIFRALADSTRLRIMRLIAAMELAVGEVAQVLGQSQPRVSRHISILCEAGLAERRREGSWTFLRAVSGKPGSDPVEAALAQLLALAEQHDPEFSATCQEDRRKLAAIRSAREAEAEEYFAAHAEDWDELRRLHSSDDRVEEALSKALAGHSLGRVLDIGTGTGRMAELFADHAEHILALDKSLAMLRVARAKLQHLPTNRVELVQGDFAQLPLPADSIDTVLFHQVLHFAQDPASALREAARVTRDGGRIAIVDFAAHQREDLRDRHAHARLGFEDGPLAEMLRAAGFAPEPPTALDDGELVIKIWTGERLPAAREVVL